MTESPETRPRVRISDLSKRYGADIVLDSVSLTIADGEFVTLLGPSGSGKSTLLNLIAGVIAPTTGSIMIDDSDVTNMPTRVRGLGMVFQSYALIPHLTVFGNVAFPLRIRGMPRRAIEAAVSRALDQVQLTAYRNRRPRELSGGQQQRVAIARCLVYASKLILMDEPLGALDKTLRESLQREIRSLHTRLGTTVLYVTHDQEEAMSLSDRICVMNKGRIEQIGTPNDLYFSPGSRFVAGFLGDSNLLEGTVIATGDPCRIELRNGVVIAANPGARWPPVAGKVFLLIRPERIRLLKSGETHVNTVEGTVEEVEFIGGLTRIKLALGAGVSVMIKQLTGTPSDLTATGINVTAAWSAEDTLLLSE